MASEINGDSAPEVASESEQEDLNEKSDDQVQVSYLDYLLYVPFVIAWCVVLITFDLLQRIAILFGQRYHEKVISILNETLVMMLRIVRVSVRVRYEIPLKRNVPCLVLANHQSLYDIPILYSVFRGMRPRFVAKKELAHWIPSVSFNLRHGGAAIIDRSNPRQAITELAQFAESMVKDGFTGILFPEGTRARKGVMKEFQAAGVATILRKIETISVIPVTIEGSWRLFPFRYGPIPRGTLIRVTVHKPIVWSKGMEVEPLVRSAEQCIKNRQEIDAKRHEKGIEANL